MYFYVFLQPEVFEEAVADGEDATQNVAGILTGFQQNCFLAVFEDGRWDPSVREKLELWPENMTRKRVVSMLVHLKKRGRFLYSVAPDYDCTKPDIEYVFAQASMISLDLILVIASEVNRTAPSGVEVITRRSYQATAFEPMRSNLAVYGKTCSAGEMGEVDFLEFHFKKALMHAREIHICDRVCGKKNLADNFRYTIRRLVTWLGKILSDPLNCRIVFHLGEPEGRGSEFVRHEIASLKVGHLSGTSIEVEFYDDSLPGPSLPHQRFILTDQIAIGVDRGLDFLDRATGRCRDTCVYYQEPIDTRKLLVSLQSGRIPSQPI